MTAVAAVLALAGGAAGCGSQQQSPASGRPWRVAYDGYGQVRFAAGHITMRPARARSAHSTHAALVLSARSWRDVSIGVRLRTDRQLRRPRPRPWEVGWVVWHYVDNQHFYYLALKPDGWELGKESPGYPGDQRFLATGRTPAFPPGRWYSVSVQQRGQRIQVSVDGRQLVRFTDSRDPYLGGYVGLYTEDASVTFQPTGLTAIP
ncbi:MAG TPA: family 16 glycoside hydrolase [Streptosporangiaceae bacterium]|jgi:hypothetical protein